MSIEESSKIGCFSKVTEGVYYGTQDDSKVASSEMVEKLKSKALYTEKKRARLCFHDSENASVHTMVIALTKGSLVRRHVHPKSNETYVIIDGELQISVYEEGERKDFFLHKDQVLVFQVPAGVEHSVCSVSEVAVFVEIAGGPFEQSNTIYK